MPNASDSSRRVTLGRASPATSAERRSTQDARTRCAIAHASAASTTDTAPTAQSAVRSSAYTHGVSCRDQRLLPDPAAAEQVTEACIADGNRDRRGHEDDVLRRADRGRATHVEQEQDAPGQERPRRGACGCEPGDRRQLCRAPLRPLGGEDRGRLDGADGGHSREDKREDEEEGDLASTGRAEGAGEQQYTYEVAGIPRDLSREKLGGTHGRRIEGTFPGRIHPTRTAARRSSLRVWPSVLAAE